MNDIVRRYVDTWNADATTRRSLLAAHWSPAVTYVDPLAEVDGHDGIDALVGGVQSQFPGFVLTPIGEPDAHHRQVRFQWGLGPEGSEPLVVGFDVLVVDDEDRIADVRGFLDRVPS